MVAVDVGVMVDLLNVFYCYCHLSVVDDDSVSVSVDVSRNEFHWIFFFVSLVKQTEITHFEKYIYIYLSAYRFLVNFSYILIILFFDFCVWVSFVCVSICRCDTNKKWWAFVLDKCKEKLSSKYLSKRLWLWLWLWVWLKC